MAEKIGCGMNSRVDKKLAAKMNRALIKMNGNKSGVKDSLQQSN